VNSDRALECLEGNFSQILEEQALPDAPLGNHVRDQNP
jgi:hypothetical protein